MRQSILTKEEKAYIAGFLDGDGSIFAQLVRRHDYKFGFQIRVSVVFFQKKENIWFLNRLQKDLQAGTVRVRNDNMAELSIIGHKSVEAFIKEFYPYLQLKKPIARTVLAIIMESRKVGNDSDRFLEVCKLVDKTAQLTYSKKRTITSAIVQEYLKKHDSIIESL
jgi:hypothetical protein